MLRYKLKIKQWQLQSISENAAAEVHQFTGSMSTFNDFCKTSCTEFPFYRAETRLKNAGTKAVAGWVGGRVRPLPSLHPRAAHACLPGKKESL